MPTVDFARIPGFYHKYIEKVRESDLSEAMEHHPDNILPLLKSLPDKRWDLRYEEGKWTIREVVQHLIDAERIFCYRALCFARKDNTPLPGFEENDYVKFSKATNRSTPSLIMELEAVQKASVSLFKSFDEEQLNESGIANNNSIYVEAIGFIVIGHVLHHKDILIERYLKNALPA